MDNLNSVLIEGNMVRDPLLRNTEKGTAICSFTIASTRYYRQESELEKEVSFFNVEAYRKLGEEAYKRGKKGAGVRVVGRLKQDRWIGNDSKEHSAVTIVSEHIEFRATEEAVSVEELVMAN